MISTKEKGVHRSTTYTITEYFCFFCKKEKTGTRYHIGRIIEEVNNFIYLCPECFLSNAGEEYFFSSGQENK